MRKIIHVDMDAFFASIEQRDNEEYRGKPLAVGSPEARGVVAAASYEARRYGVHSAMSSKVALRKCPYLLFAAPRFDVYKSVSTQIMNIFLEYTDLVEPLSLDEAFLDVSACTDKSISATQIAQEIKKKILTETGLVASAGVSYNKFLAKIASDYNKPNGLFIIRPKDGERFAEDLPIERFFGVGKVTAKRMHDLGIKTGFDLKKYSEQQLTALFGKTGILYYQNARGIDLRVVESERVRKSIGAENTFTKDIDSIDLLSIELHNVAEEVIRRITEQEFKGRTLSLKIKYADFRSISRSKTLSSPIVDLTLLYRTGLDLLEQIDIRPKVRLIGLTIKHTENSVWQEAIQLRIPFAEE